MEMDFSVCPEATQTLKESTEANTLSTETLLLTYFD